MSRNKAINNFRNMNLTPQEMSSIFLPNTSIYCRTCKKVRIKKLISKYGFKKAHRENICFCDENKHNQKGHPQHQSDNQEIEQTESPNQSEIITIFSPTQSQSQSQDQTDSSQFNQNIQESFESDSNMDIDSDIAYTEEEEGEEGEEGEEEEEEEEEECEYVTKDEFNKFRSIVKKEFKKVNEGIAKIAKILKKQKKKKKK